MTRTPLFFINTHSGDGSKEVSAINLTIGRYQVEACAGQTADARIRFQNELTRRLQAYFPKARISIVQVPASNDGTWMLATNGADEAKTLQDCQDILAGLIQETKKFADYLTSNFEDPRD